MLRILPLIPLTVGLALAGAIAHAGDGTLRVTQADCAKLVEHRPAADVAYKPGVDVHGRAVVPADLDGGARIELPDTILIPITVDLQDRFGIPANSALFDGTAFIGIASFRFSDGKVTFNGRELTDPETRALAAACQRAAPAY